MGHHSILFFVNFLFVFILSVIFSDQEKQRVQIYFSTIVLMLVLVDLILVDSHFILFKLVNMIVIY